MPLDYAIETDVKPIIRDFRTGAVIDPGGAGEKFVVDRHGKRVPYEILPDGTPSPTHRGRRIKVENTAYDHLEPPDVKLEDEDKDASRTLTPGRQDAPRGQLGATRQGAAQTTAQPRTPRPSARERDRRLQAMDSPSDDDSSDGTGSSSSEDDSSDEDVSSDDSSSSSSLEADDRSIVDVSSVFRPSRSPSRMPDTPSATTRSRSHVKEDEDWDSDAPLTPSPSCKRKPTSQATSVPRPPTMTFYIPIRQTDCQNRPSRGLPSRTPVPVRAPSTISPTASRGHGWNPINKERKQAKQSRPGDERAIPTGPAASTASRQPHTQTSSASRHYRAATAGPSVRVHGPAADQSPGVHSSQKGKGCHASQSSSQAQSSSTPRSPKGKGKAIAVTSGTARQNHGEQFQQRHPQVDKTKSKAQGRDQHESNSQDGHANKRLLDKKSKSARQRANRQARKQQMSAQANTFTRHGPSRQARVERSIEETPRLGLPTPDPSSAIGNTPGPSTPSPARSEPGMFMTSPVQPATPGSSTQHAPRMFLESMNSSPPSHRSKKRSRSVYENSDEAAIGAVANKILERFERKAQEMQAEERLGRERLEQKIENERIERQRFEQGWEQQFARAKNDERLEREHFALGLEEKMAHDRKEDQDERRRLGVAMAEHETRITTLQGQMQGQSERLESRVDGQVSRLSTLQGQFDGQRARNNIFGTRLENHIRKLDELTKRLDEIDRREQINQDITKSRLQRLEAATFSAGRVPSQQLPIQARSSGTTRPQVHEVRPREAFDLGMRGRPAKAVIPDTLIRSEHGKPCPRTLPPCPQRNHVDGSLSSLRPAKPPATHQSSASHTGKPNEGALRQNRSIVQNTIIPQAQHSTNSLSVRSSSDTAHPTAESCVQPNPIPTQGHPALTIHPLAPEIQPQPASPPASEARSSLPTAASEPTPPPPPGLPRLTHQEMKALVFRRPLSGLDLSIAYDQALDDGQTTAATAFLLNMPQRLVARRFHAFLNRPAFAFALDDPAARAKGCWAVRAAGPQDAQFKLYHNERNYAFTLNRLAVRLWHGDESVLRLLLSKDHKAVHLCHNKYCFHPDHIVVESRKEHADRWSCVREGRCEGHPVWSKCGQMVERRRCIFTE